MIMSSQEGYWKKKIESLDKRLTLIEKFVELRFKEHYAHISPKLPTLSSTKEAIDHDHWSYSSVNDGDSLENYGDNQAKSASPKPLPSNISKRGRKPATIVKCKSVRDALRNEGNDQERTNPITMKECFVRIVREELPVSSSCPYGTRRQKRLAELIPKVVKKEPRQDDISLSDAVESSSMQVDHDFDIQEEDDGKSTYFIFPLVPENDPSVKAGNEADVKDHERKPKIEEKVHTGGEITGRRSRKLNLKKAYRKRKELPQPPKKRTYINKFGSLSMSKLSDAKVVSTDTSRGECPVCHKHFIHELLPIHMATHTKERHLKCTHCDKMFWKRETLKKHVLTVHDMDNYKRRCRHCGKPIVGNLLHHEQFCIRRAWENNEEIDPKLIEDIQIRVKRLGRTFTLPDKSKKIEYDPNERKDCPSCGKSFLLKYYDRHVKTHDKARNWKCSKCPKAYIHKHDLVRHMIQTHENIPTCEFCNSTFDTRNDLHLHKIKVCVKDLRRKGEYKHSKDEEEKQDAEADAEISNIISKDLSEVVDEAGVDATPIEHFEELSTNETVEGEVDTETMTPATSMGGVLLENIVVQEDCVPTVGTDEVIVTTDAPQITDDDEIPNHSLTLVLIT